VSAPSTRLRLRAAAALCVLPLGLAWGTGPGVHQFGAQVPARVLLAFAAAVLLVASVGNRTHAMKQATRAATGAAGGGLALALGAHAVAAAGCLAAVTVLVFPLVRPRKPGVFVPAPVRR
jgi:hypothetical protein